MVVPGAKDPCNCMHTPILGLSKCDQKLGKVECVFSLYNEMRWKWDDVYVLPGSVKYILPVTMSSSGTPESPYIRRRSLLYLEAVINHGWRVCSSMFGCQNQSSVGMHMETGIRRTRMLLGGGIELVWRCPWRLRDRVNSEMHLEAVIQLVWSSTCCQNQVNSEMHMESVIEHGGRYSDSFHWLIHNCGNGGNWVQQGPLRAEITG